MFACIYICTLHVYLLSYKRQKMVSNFLQLELQLVLNYHVDSGNGTQFLCRNSKRWAISSALASDFFAPTPCFIYFLWLTRKWGNICITEIWITKITSLSQKLDAWDLHWFNLKSYSFQGCLEFCPREPPSPEHPHSSSKLAVFSCSQNTKTNSSKSFFSSLPLRTHVLIPSHFTSNVIFTETSHNLRE